MKSYGESSILLAETEDMGRFSTLLLDVWRESCRHIEIGESLARIAPLLAKRLPLGAVLVRRIEPERRCRETLGAAECRVGGVPEVVRSEVDAPAIESLV